MDAPDLYTAERERMVEWQIAERGIRQARLLEALRRTPRHLFVPREFRHLAYTDGPLPIGAGQTISQPYIVALMSELLALQGGETVLEIGTGSGYQAAILACLAARVHTIERHAELAGRARALLEQLGLGNVTVHVGDGSLGLAEYAPYQGILVTAAAPNAPRPLLDQLAEDGRMVIPVGSEHGQYLQLWTRRGERYEHTSIVPVAFVPLRGEHGWNVEKWGIPWE
jgi:protein-L-isoaspartate(D-aspartate) O-methyltransferase